MRVLFVSSGNSRDFSIAPFIKAQGDSLERLGIDVLYFPLIGKGLLGYVRSAYKLNKFVRKNAVDIVHAHYTLSGWTSVLAHPKKPIILSLMGSDAYGEYIGHNKVRKSSYYLVILTWLIQPFVKAIICKSKNIEKYVYLKNKSKIIPNGILLEKVIVNDKGFRDELGLDPTKKYILFLGNLNDIRKNFKLVKDSCELLNIENVEIITPYPVAHDIAIKYLNSVDVLVVPSFMEGSPNVVKEAMACNCPVVATDVGDIKWLFGNEPGYFISDFSAADTASKITNALDFADKYRKTNGRARLIKLGLDSETIAHRIIQVYQEVRGNG
ncbi:glycosyltransferase [Lentimicrobium saccharophilum]|uniref:Glycosyltransferase n=1 Tax=Lentimicrobium saccharophilum TaxID=1678841 RepID=A0A0S7BPD4_9BACT|nr:glycosyltransferase family 4 protein [Lentimicrobium saccharophilum]GAP42362.1 glycosyltransferase [Lentimicrobium saccharophilum]